jgi:hypothetical protein
MKSKKKEKERISYYYPVGENTPPNTSHAKKVLDIRLRS